MKSKEKDSENKFSMVDVGALWKKKDYWSGVIRLPEGEIEIIVLENQDKSSDRHPDYLIEHDDEKIGALWEREAKSGIAYLAGEVNYPDQVFVKIFKNKFKKEKKHPDYRIYVDSPAEETTKGEDEPIKY